MNEFSLYILKSVVGLMVLYAFYWCFLKQETFFVLNRFYLLASLLVSFIFPLLNLPFGVEFKGNLTTELLAPVIIKSNSASADYSTISTFRVGLIVYLSGVLYFLGSVLWQLIRFSIKYQKYPKILYEGFKTVIIKTEASSASFFGILFISQHDLDGNRTSTIIAHENYHKSQFHSLDIILIEILIIMQWFNPFIWLYKNALQAQHEYAADRNMIKQGEDKFQYQSLLFEKGVGIRLNNFMNYFNNSLLKTRIKMMNKNESKSWVSLKYLLALPLFALLSVGFFPNQDVFAQQNTDTHVQVDEMPVYPGGLDAMYKFIAKTIKYPKSSRQSRAEGRVFVSFVVNKKGAVTNVEVDETQFRQNVAEEIVVVGYSNNNTATNATKDMEALIAEAKNVVSKLERFTPGKNGGESVKVKITIPILFKLG